MLCFDEHSRIHVRKLAWSAAWAYKWAFPLEHSLFNCCMLFNSWGMLSNSLPSSIPQAFRHCTFAKVCYHLIFPNTWHPFLYFLPHWGRRARWGVRFRRPWATPYMMNIKSSSWGRWQESQPLVQRGSDGQTWILQCVLMWIWVDLGEGESCWDQRPKMLEALCTDLHVTEHLGEVCSMQMTSRAYTTQMM